MERDPRIPEDREDLLPRVFDAFNHELYELYPELALQTQALLLRRALEQRDELGIPWPDLRSLPFPPVVIATALRTFGNSPVIPELVEPWEADIVMRFLPAGETVIRGRSRACPTQDASAPVWRQYVAARVDRLEVELTSARGRLEQLRASLLNRLQ